MVSSLKPSLGGDRLRAEVKQKMAKAKNIALHRQDGTTKKSGTVKFSTTVRRVQVRDRRIAITLYLDKSDALRLAKEIRKRWGEE
jgi:hypothetical protein